MMNNQSVLVAGGGGFIGGHLVRDLLASGCERVRCVDVKPLEQWHQVHPGAENVVADLNLRESAFDVAARADVIYNLACNMGGMGFIEKNKGLCMVSVLINTHLLLAAQAAGVSRYFYASSACVYNADRQRAKTTDAFLREADAYPAEPEDGYGWEKLFSERMCRHFREDFGVPTRVARFHNVYGTHGTFEGGREKAPAAICRKVIEAKLGGTDRIKIWGDGNQTRSFMYIDDCLEGIRLITESEKWHDPINLGSSEGVSINQLVDIVEEIAGVELKREYDLTAPQGVNGRNSDNTLIKKVFDWAPSTRLKAGLEKTYAWIFDQMAPRYRESKPASALIIGAPVTRGF